MIRKAHVGDAERLAEIIIYGWRMAYTGLFSDEYLYGRLLVVDRYKFLVGQLSAEHGYYVYEENDVIKGFVAMGNCRDADCSECAYELIAMYVEPAFKYKGIGAKMLAKCAENARSLGKERVKIWVFEDNLNTRKFYEKYGYAPDGATKIPPAVNQPEIRMEKTL